MRLANHQGDDSHHRRRLPTDPEQDRQPEDEHPDERTEEGSEGRQLDAWRNLGRCRPRVRPSLEDRRPDMALRSVEDDPAQVCAVSLADDIEVDGDGLGKLGSIDHGACLVIGVGAIGVGVEYRTAGNGRPYDVRTVPRPQTEPDPRARLRHPGDALPNARIGTVPILWHHADHGAPAVRIDPVTVLDEIARLGYEGTQLDEGLPEGAELRASLAARGLRLAEVYAALPANPTGLGPDALAIGRERLRLLVEGGGDVLCVALDGSPDRDARAGRADSAGTPRLSDAAWQELTQVLEALADDTIAAGRRLAFHPHAGTYVETPAEVERLVTATDASRVGICLDVGHHVVGGGDPLTTLEWLGERVTHVHLKDVDPAVQARLTSGALSGLGEAVDRRIFTELGSGSLDLLGVLRVLARGGYAGWLMVEQDSSWSPPSEAAAIGRRVLGRALATIGAEGGSSPR